jgi:hypothetical protein
MRGENVPVQNNDYALSAAAAALFFFLYLH